MNTVKLRQILDLRRSTKIPPLIPPRPQKNRIETATRKGDKEIIDIHLQFINFNIYKTAEDTPIVCVFSESEDSQNGPWKVSTASEVTFCKGQQTLTLINNLIPKPSTSHSVSKISCILCTTPYVNLPDVFAVEFQLERCHLIKLDICELLEQRCISLGYAIFSVSELVVNESGSISRSIINDETGDHIAEALISCTLRPKPHSILLQFAAKNLVKKNLLFVNPTQIFFEVYRVESSISLPFSTMLASENLSFQNFHQQSSQEGLLKMTNSNTILSNSISNNKFKKVSNTMTNKKLHQKTQLHTTTLLYRSEFIKYSSSRIVWRAFTLQSTEINGKVLELVCMYRDAKTNKGLLGRFFMEFEQLKKGPSPENIYFLIYENSRNQQKTCGMFELLKITQIALPSFLEYVSSGCTLNFACAIDFSRAANVSSANESSIRCYLDDVELVIRAIGEPLRHFNKNNLFPAFGFGARIPPHFRESQEFCLKLEPNPYCRGIDGIQEAFRNAFANVQPLNIAHLSHVIYYVAKLAQNAISRLQTSNTKNSSSFSKIENPSYYVLLILTRGVFDDLKETVQSIIFASRAPISIIFASISDESNLTNDNIYTTNQNLNGMINSEIYTTSNKQSNKLQPVVSELERMANAGTRLNYHGRKLERDCVQFVSLVRCRHEESNITDLKALIAERSLLNISWQMSTWLTKNGYRSSSTIIADPILELSDEFKSNTKFNQNISDSASTMRQKSKVLVSNVGAKLMQLATRRCRGGIWCQHTTNEFNDSSFYEDNDDESIASN